jgi:outer membrane protein assembly factor BamB
MKKITFAFFILLIAALLAGCSGGQARLTASSWPGVTAADDAVYVAYGYHVYALNPDTGIQRWQFPQEADTKISFFAPPVLAQDASQLIVGGYDNLLYSLDPETGEAGWVFAGASNRYIAAPLATDSRIFAPSADGRLYALGMNGQPVWQEPFHSEDAIWSTPARDGETLYQSGLDGILHAIDAGSGAELWATDLGSPVANSPALNGGMLYAGTFGNSVVAVDAATGDIAWQQETADWVWASPAVDAGVVYAGDISGILYALDAASGDEIWRFEANGAIYGAPLIVDGSIHFGTETGNFYALTPDKELSWSLVLTGQIYSTPALGDDLFIIATLQSETLLTAVDLNGDTRWTFTPEN